MTRALATVAVVFVAIAALSHASSRSGASGGTPTVTTSQQSDEVLPDGAPTANAPPSDPAYTGTLPPRPRTGDAPRRHKAFRLPLDRD